MAQAARTCTRSISLLDLFGASERMSRAWQSHGLLTASYDIKNDQQDDITTRGGFFRLAERGLLLVAGALIFAAPPCSLFIFLSSSVHRRKAANDFRGDQRRFKVRLSNCILQNMVCFLRELAVFRHFYLVIEQPTSSVMWKVPEMKDLLSSFRMKRVFTWLGLFGHRLQKGTNLWVALPGAQALSRRMTKARRAAFVKRQSQSSGGGHRDYTRHEDGTVSGGPDLQSSAIYPAPFCRQVFKVAKLVLAGFCML
ncbi:unnamed protein product [Durusdinium trenchii]